MIDELHVENIALIKEATLEPSSRMTVLTGETGAGKTALLSACRLAMGHRADKTIVREGEDEATCEIRLFEESEASDAPGIEIVASRRVSADGRSRCKIDGSMVSVSELAGVIGSHIDLCSQHDQQLLASVSTQRSLLDSWSGVSTDGLLDAYRDAYAQAKEKAKHLQDVMELAQTSDNRLQDAKLVFKQISTLNPSAEDYEQIAASLKKAENAELLARTSSQAQSALDGEGGTLDSMNAAVVLLEEGGREDETLQKLAESLREAVYIAEDVSRDVSSYSSAIEFDVGELEFMQERMAAYQSILRSYGPDLEDVFDKQHEASLLIDAAENSDKSIEGAKRELQEAEEALYQAAEKLSDTRAASAPAFTKEANAVLSRLQMQGASIEIQSKMLSRDSWTEDGPDEIRLMFTPAEGMQPRLLSRIASGGELSRVMLAIRAVMGERDNVETLVFDEIDAGVGGEAALALSDVLADLSSSHQVIVVTHLPQVASKADKHYVVKKAEDANEAYTELGQVDGDDRVREIARMLSGTITESSLAHARELMEL